MSNVRRRGKSPAATLVAEKGRTIISTTLPTTEQTKPEPRPRRRWVQYSLRSLLVLTLLLSVVCSWYAVAMYRARKQREAVAALGQFAGVITYDYERVGANEPPGPQWLRHLMGDDVFAHVDYLCLGGNDEFTDATLEHVRWLPRLRVFLLQDAAITNDGLRHFEGLAHLERLSLYGIDVNDEGLKHLAKLPRLRSLQLDSMDVTDEGLRHIKSLVHLEDLAIYGDGITDDGLEHLAALPQLQTIDLDSEQITDEGMKKLQQALPNCDLSR